MTDNEYFDLHPELAAKGTIRLHGGGYPNVFDRDMDISLKQIAISLSRTPRFNGHCKYNISVLEHCCDVAELIERQKLRQDISAAALLHDSEEAIFGDIATPIKVLLTPYQRRMMLRVRLSILKEHGLLPVYERFEHVIKHADYTCFKKEWFRNMIGLLPEGTTSAVAIPTPQPGYEIAQQVRFARLWQKYTGSVSPI